jgi:acetoin:2,6-dichlorophenolindophenol oxidoreductase subunit alpha
MAKILDKQSSRGTETANGSPAPSLIPQERLLAIYTAMVKCRMLQQRAATLFQQGKLNADLHASLGREACAAAVGVDLQPEDILSIVPGDWLPAFAKGLPVELIFRALASRGEAQSTARPDDAAKRNILEAGAEQAAMVRGHAENLRSAKSPAIVVAFFKNDAAAGNQWQKVISAAAEKRLPILFVQHAPGSITKVSPTRSRSKEAHALFQGVPVIGVDAADPVALYRVAYEAIVRARQGRGATFLECAVPVLNAVDPATNQPVPPPDAVAIMETYLKGKGISYEASNRQTIAEFTRDLDLATRFLGS